MTLLKANQIAEISPVSSGIIPLTRSLVGTLPPPPPPAHTHTLTSLTDPVIAQATCLQKIYIHLIISQPDSKFDFL